MGKKATALFCSHACRSDCQPCQGCCAFPRIFPMTGKSSTCHVAGTCCGTRYLTKSVSGMVAGDKRDRSKKARRDTSDPADLTLRTRDSSRAGPRGEKKGAQCHGPARSKVKYLLAYSVTSSVSTRLKRRTYEKTRMLFRLRRKYMRTY